MDKEYIAGKNPVLEALRAAGKSTKSGLRKVHKKAP